MNSKWKLIYIHSCDIFLRFSVFQLLFFNFFSLQRKKWRQTPLWCDITRPYVTCFSILAFMIIFILTKKFLIIKTKTIKNDVFWLNPDWNKNFILINGNLRTASEWNFLKAFSQYLLKFVHYDFLKFICKTKLNYIKKLKLLFYCFVTLKKKFSLRFHSDILCVSVMIHGDLRNIKVVWSHLIHEMMTFFLRFITILIFKCNVKKWIKWRKSNKNLPLRVYNK